jgi:hypothetical protein
LLQMLYSVQSERIPVEQLEYNLLFRWFVGLPLSEHAWDATSFAKNRERLLSGEVVRRTMPSVPEAQAMPLPRAWMPRRSAVVGAVWICHRADTGNATSNTASEKAERIVDESDGAEGAGQVF